MIFTVDTSCWHNTSSVFLSWCWQSICDVDTIHLGLSLHDVDSRYVMLTQLTQCIQCCPYMMLTVDMWCWHNTCSVAFTWCWQTICDVYTIHLVLSFIWCWTSIYDVDTMHLALSLLMLNVDMWCWHNTSSVVFTYVERRYVMLTQYI